MKIKKQLLWMIGIIFCLFFLIPITFHLTNPLRHSIKKEDFNHIVKEISSNCGLEPLEIMTIEFDMRRFSAWVRLHILIKKILCSKLQVYPPCRFFSERYFFSNENNSLVLISSGFDNNVCFIDYEFNFKKKNLEKGCLEELKLNFKNMLISRH